MASRSTQKTPAEAGAKFVQELDGQCGGWGRLAVLLIYGSALKLVPA